MRTSSSVEKRCSPWRSSVPRPKGAVPDLVKLLADEDPEVVYGATYALGKIGPDAAAAIPALEEGLASEDGFRPVASAWALIRIQPEDEATVAMAVPLMAERLDKLTPTAQLEVISTLGELGVQAQEALPALRNAAETSEEHSVREAAAEAIQQIEQ